ncbi:MULTISPECIES: IS630 family transposase [unclassified Dysgonomonas]|uniref:IS630 family transposase n=1 Tax=unclassified Dysgonomonas TaxID=2630389 RepID=UPI002473BA2C|nr:MULTISPECIES: IS630 family transposase [unclassified Dysgonomonas]
MRRRPRGVPSPRLYEYKTAKLQELETLYAQGEINLFYGDESHVCTEGYVPYGWQFPGENLYISSQRAKRLNIFGMISRDNHFEGFCSCESIDAQKVVSFLDQYSFKVTKKTFVVLDNASVHRNAKIRLMRPLWEKRGLFLFYIPPYSPHLNIAETLWRIMKGKWLRPQDYASADTLFYATNRALADIGKNLRINYNHKAA